MSAKLTKYQLHLLSEDFMSADRVLWHSLVDGNALSISYLFRVRYPAGVSDPNPDARRKQQLLGVCFSRMNPLLEKHGLRIAPGVPRQTYQLREIA